MFCLTERQYSDQLARNIQYDYECQKSIEEYRENLRKINNVKLKKYNLSFFKKGNDCIELVEFKNLEKK